MSPEDTPQHIHGSEQETDLKREMQEEALELELKNYQVEEMPEGKEREQAIREMDTLNDELSRLEEMTGLSTDEVLREYTRLTFDAAERGIKELLMELRIEEPERVEVERALQNGDPSLFLEKVRLLFPKKLAVAAASFLTITLATATFAADQGHAAESQFAQPSYTIEQVRLDNEGAAVEVQEQAKHIIKETNAKAKELIENVSGFIKPLAQKKVIDAVADRSGDIVSYLSGNADMLPQVDNETADAMLKLYVHAIEMVDALNNHNLSEEFRNEIISKIKLVGTKDYDKIKQEFSA